MYIGLRTVLACYPLQPLSSGKEEEDKDKDEDEDKNKDKEEEKEA